MASKSVRGKFVKQCGTHFMHSIWDIDRTENIGIRRNIPTKVLTLLDKIYKNKQYSTTASYCKGCISHVESKCTECEKYKTQSLTSIIQTQTDDSVKILHGDLSTSDKEELAFNLGKSEAKSITNDCKLLSTMYKDVDLLMQLNLEVYKRKRNKVVIAFLDGITSEINTKPSLFNECIAIENIYSLSNSHLLAPLSFISNLVQYETSQSKFVINLNAKLGPSGSYPTVSNWLMSQSTNNIAFPKSDCIVAFDNDQVVGKTWFIKADNKVNSSVITSVCAAELHSFHQFDESLHPKNWFQYDGFSEKLQEVRNKNGDEYNGVYDIHYRELYENLDFFVKKKVYNEQIEAHCHDTGFSDCIDQSIQNDTHLYQTITCDLCGTSYNKSKIKCDICKVNIRETHKRHLTEETESDNERSKKRVRQIEKEINFHTERKPFGQCNTSEQTKFDKHDISFQVLDPFPLNPNSYDSVRLVLRKIGLEAGVKRYENSGTGEKKHRQWIFVLCDGLPYGIAHKLIHDTYYCIKCNDSVLGIEGFKQHNLKKHNGETTQIIFEFDWVVLLIGKGHFEMNMMKSFFELNWEPFLKNLAVLMGFKSEKSLNCAKLCRDNHKSWQMLKIFYFGSLQELLIPYVREVIKNNNVPSADGYINWCKRCKNPNYLYMHEQVLTYSQALLNYRLGLRSYNFNLTFSGKEMFDNIFYGRQHPKYQYISLMETCDYFMYPPVVRSMVETYCSFDTSSTGIKGEDLDFKLESINKKSKAWITGVPNFDTWLRVFRNLDNLDTLRRWLLQSLCIQPNDNYQNYNDTNNDLFHNEIFVWRKFLRRKSYLLQPKENGEHVTVCGDKLDDGLINFTNIATVNRQMFFDKIISSGSISEACKLKPVYVTPIERETVECIHNQSKDTICKLIESCVYKLGDDAMRQYYINMLDGAKCQRKEYLISLYNEIYNDIQDISSDSEEDDNNND